MEFEFWNERWHDGRIAFHTGRVHPQLVAHWSRLGGDASLRRVLVPLCGKAVDLAWLAEHTEEVVGVEFVRAALEAFVAEHGLSGAWERLGSGEVFRAPPLQLVAGDFFTVDLSASTPFDLVFDRAALVALQPERRDAYLARLARLLRPEGRMLLINLIHDIPTGGPPHSIPEDELLRVGGPHFEWVKLREQDALKDEPRFAERGATYFVEQVWEATPRVTGAGHPA